MSIFDDFDIIWDHSHYWNWSPDWLVVKEVYEKVPNSYSVLMPFAYSYFEEMIAALKEAASILIDIHGQHEHQSLLYKKNHLAILDAFAKENVSTVKDKVSDLYRSYKSYKKELEEALAMNKELINTDIAECLYLGIVHDTGVFQYSCTSPETMEAAADLMRRNIRANEIIDKTDIIDFIGKKIKEEGYES